VSKKTRRTAPDPTRGFQQADGDRFVRSPANRLAAAFGRLMRVVRAQPKPRHPDDDEPIGNWQQRTDERLLAIEKTLANQNRLLLMSAIAIAADAAIKVFKL